MRKHRFSLGFTAAALALSASGALAQSITPSSVNATIGVGETLIINKSITLGAAGATTVDLFFLADNTGSMGSIVNAAKAGATAIMAGLPSTYRFGAGRYLGDPSEGVPPGTAYTENTALTFDQSAVQAGINSWFASGGGDFPEANFFALQQVASTAAWRPEAQRLVVWFGDAPSHTATTTQAQAVAALQAANAKVVAFNSSSAGSGIDQGGQASGIVGGAGGSLTNNFLSLSSSAFVSTVNAQISAATSFINLTFGSTFSGTGLALEFLCTDPLGCNNVGAGETRTFDLAITGMTPGTYEFNVFAQGVEAFEADRITVLDGTAVAPEPVSMILLATGLFGLGLVRRRRRNLQDFA